MLAYGYTLAAGYVIRPKLRIAAFIKVYLTIVKKTAKQDREGRIHYSEEELIRYMAVSPMMGRRLFPYAENGEHQILLGNRRENRGFSVENSGPLYRGSCLWRCLFSCILSWTDDFVKEYLCWYFIFMAEAFFLPD